jgi:serine/threonine-protein kinase
VEEDPQVVAKRVTDSPIREDLLAVLDDWSACASDVAQRAWVLDVVRHADPDPWRDQVRDPANWKKPKVLAALADKATVAAQSPQLLVVLAARLRNKQIDTRPFITRVALAHPTDFWVNLEAADTLQYTNKFEAMGYLRAALVIRPKIASVHAALGTLYFHEGRWLEAFEHLDKAVQLNPTDPLLYTVLGESLHVVGRHDEAIAAFGKALKLAPNDVSAHFLRSKALEAQGRLAEALDDCKAALQAASQLAGGKTKGLDLVALKDKLRSLCLQLNRGPELLPLWQKQLAAGPPEHDAWFGYAELCLFLGNVKEYERHREELFARFGGTKDPVVAERVSRACLLLPWATKKQQQAAALIEFALAAPPPKHFWVHPYFLFAKGLAEYRLDRFQSAIQLMEGPAGMVMGPSPRLVMAMAQHRSEQEQKARKTLAAAVLSFDWRAVKADNHDLWIAHILRREAETLILPQLPEFLAGQYEPQDNDERLALLGICQFKELRLAMARLYADIFAADPNLAEDLNAVGCGIVMTALNASGARGA